jgi:hypothetical protein
MITILCKRFNTDGECSTCARLTIEDKNDVMFSGQELLSET